MLQYKKMCIGILVALITTAAAISIAAFSIVKTGRLPNEQTAAFLMAVLCGVGIFVGSWGTVRAIGKRGLLHGTVIGAICSVIYLIAVTVLGDGVLSAATALRVALFVLCGGIAGILGVSRRKDKIQF